MLGKKRNFKSRSDYHEWLAYGHIHEVYDDGPGRKEFFVGTKRKKGVRSAYGYDEDRR